jgi:hypothetical protein
MSTTTLENPSTTEQNSETATQEAPPRTLTIASKQWASRPEDERYQSLDELSRVVKARLAISREETVSLHDVSAEAFDDGLRVMIEGNEPGAPTNWSFGQLAKAADFRVSELRKLSAPTAAAVINEQLQKRDNQDIKVMRLLGEEQDFIQAVTSPSYGRIFDADVVDMVQKVVEMSDGKFHNPKAYAHGEYGKEPVPSGLYASDRDVFMFMVDGGSVFDEGERAQFNRGFIVSNSEVGKSSLLVMSFMFNTVCGNHYIFGASGINMRRIIHSAGAPGRFATDAFDELMLFAKQPVDLSAISEAQQIKLIHLRPGSHDFETERDKWIKAFADVYGFSAVEVRAAISQAVIEEGQCQTVFDLAQGFTASARTIPHTDTRIEFERRVGAWLDKITK